MIICDVTQPEVKQLFCIETISRWDGVAIDVNADDHDGGDGDDYDEQEESGEDDLRCGATRKVSD